MSSIVPTAKPRLSSSKLLELIAPFNVNREKHPVLIVGIRGYYLRSMGEASKNDIGIYDDAIFVHTSLLTATYNANTDPSYVRKGEGRGARKGMAKLKAGYWAAHTFGKHRNKYLALVQLKGEVTVVRDGTPDYETTGYFGINIHKGSYQSTSSEGCQTIYPDQWRSFIETVTDQAKRHFGDKWNEATIPYILLENTGQI
jgi:hypothetical protein